MPRFRRRSRRGGRRSFKRFARAITRAGSEPKKIELVSEVGTNLAQGDGVSRVLGILNLPSNLVQGDTESDFSGNSVWLKGVGVKFNASIPANPGFQKFFLRWTLFFSRSNAAGMTGTGALYANDTESDAGPIQVSPFVNPRIFDTTDADPAPYVGLSYATQFDRTNIKVLKSKVFPINAGGASNGMNLKKFFFPIKRVHQYQNPDNSAMTTTPNHGRFGSYYLIYQVFGPTGAANIANTVLGTMDWHVELYFRDP